MKHRKGIYIKTAPQEDKDTDSDDEKSKESRSKTSEVWLPETNTAFRILMSANLCSALLSNISDCDESYNYWEPLHHMITGRGFQTWEYSPTYAIRSWAYVYLHYILTWFHFGFLDNRLLVFYYIRMILGVVCTLCEVHFYNGVTLRFGNNVARLVLGFLLFGTGMFISATAFLPSTFCMYMTFLFFGSWMKGNLHHALLAVAAGAIVAWPFFAALGIPLAVDIVIRRKKYFYFVKWFTIALLTMQLPCIIIDSYYYGKSVCASMNILMYNVFTSHGPDLYGVEPFSYYFINGFLNFNIAFILALLSFIIIPLAEFIIKFKYPGYRPPTLLIGFSLSTLLIWFLVFFTRPHKEERFLFPVYPLICLSAAHCLATVQKLYCVFNLHKYVTEQWMTIVAIVTFAILSLSRSYAVFQGYHGSIDIYPKMHQISKQMDTAGKTINVCVGKEWHRFPSSFFLPDDFKLELIESEFRAQLPQHFSAPGIEGTRLVRSNFNDQNLEEKSRYMDISSCHFLIDFNNGVATNREPLYSNMTKQWSIVEEVHFLSAQNSTNRAFRAFYVPYFFWERNTFGKYQLLRNKGKKFKKKRSAE